MKESCLSLMIVILSTLSIHAAESQTSYARITKEKAMKQFNESLDRFKRCMKGDCTKMEALKVARDLAIAAVVVTTAMHITGGVIKKATTKLEGEEYFPEEYKGETYFPEGYSSAGKIAYATGQRLQYPARQIKRSAQKLISKKINIGDKVRYAHQKWIVMDKYSDGYLNIQDDTGGSISVPGHVVTKI